MHRSVSCLLGKAMLSLLVYDSFLYVLIRDLEQIDSWVFYGEMVVLFTKCICR